MRGQEISQVPQARHPCGSVRRGAQVRRGQFGQRAEGLAGVPQAGLAVGLRVGYHAADAADQGGQVGPAGPGGQGVGGLAEPVQGIPQERPAVDPRVGQHHVNTVGQLAQVGDERGPLGRKIVRCHDESAFLTGKGTRGGR